MNSDQFDLGVEEESDNLFRQPSALNLPAHSESDSLLIGPLVQPDGAFVYPLASVALLTCFVDQHLPQLLVVTGMREVKHAVSGQIKLQQKELYIYS